MAVKQKHRNYDKNEVDVDIDLGYFVPYLLDDLHRHFQSVLAKTLGPYDLIVPEWRTLTCLKRLKACTINEIIEFTALPQSTVSRTVTNLHKKSLVERSWNIEDNRVAEIRLSALGREQLDKSTSAVKQACQAEVNLLASEEAEHWVDIMRTVLTRLNPDKLRNL